MDLDEYHVPALLSEKSLKNCWLSKEDDKVFAYLQKINNLNLTN